ncbi:MAG TPA: cytochrome c oxidase subunit II [Pirellulaceae bacterium]|jgi:cytochrome c oxidase subunit 2|nr:cytochrome c oxidase subunit II [Pirellulaceae bacterium]
MFSDAFAPFQTLAAAEGSFFLPPQSSTVAPQVDYVFNLVLWISAFFFVLIVAVMIYFVVKYRHRPGHVESRTSNHNDVLEVTWSVIPALLTVVIFVEGVNSYLNMRQPPPDCYEIDVIAKKWNWTFIYPNGVVSDQLHFPVGRPVKLVMTSDDVLHSFFIPDFRVKMDVINGRYTYLWFQSDEPGEHVVYCTEYCGTKHSEMKAMATADPPEVLAAWFEKEANYVDDRELYPTLADAGAEVYRRRGCGQCHAVEADRTIVGPSFYGIYGTEELTTAGPVVVDENYIRESILQPGAKVRVGFKNQMPSFQGIIKDNEISALIAFLKSLNPAYKGADPAVLTAPVISEDPPPVGVGRDEQSQESASPLEQPDSERIDRTPER